MAPPQPKHGRRPEQVGLDAGRREALAELLQRRERRPGLGPRDEDRDEMPERRVAQCLAALELPGEEPGDVVVDRVSQRRRVRLEGLDEHAPGRVTAAASRELRHELERPLLGAEVGDREAGVGVDDRGERDAREVMALRDDLRADQDGPVRVPEALDRVTEGARPRRDVRVEPDPLELGKAPLELRLEPLRPCTDPGELDGAAGGARTAGRSPRDRSGGSGGRRPSGASGRRRRARSVATRRTRGSGRAGATPRRFRRRTARPPSSTRRPSAPSSGADSG